MTVHQGGLVTTTNDLTLDSREVSKMIDKRHADLLRSIENYIEILTDAKLRSSDFFKENSYKDKKGETRKCYLLTRKGCDMVANKITGQKGVLFTATYINRFHEMEEQLLQKNKPSYMLDDPIARAERWIEEQKEKRLLETQNKMLEQQVAEYEPKITYLDTILESKDTVLVSQIAKDYGISAQNLNNILHKSGIQYKMNGQWLLYSKHHSKGYTKSKTHQIIHKDGTESVKMHTHWTQKGRLFIHEILKDQGIVPLMDRDEQPKLELVQ